VDGERRALHDPTTSDVWEHAFMRDYKATEKGRYVEAFFRNVDWRVVEQRLLEPMAVRPAAAA
jgi:superoxide dismutase, Fe-Mn family